MLTNQPTRPSATGITGLPRAAFSEAQRIVGNEYTENVMAKRQPASKPRWTDDKAELARFDRLGLLALIQDLYAAHSRHARQEARRHRLFRQLHHAVMQDQCGAARSDTSGGQRLGKRVRAKDNQSF